MTDAGPLVQLQISLSRVPWRIAPAWSVLAGALAVAPSLADPALWLRVVAAVVLGDLAWGLLRRYVPAQGADGPSVHGLTALLPYAQPDAPVSHLVGGLALGGSNWHGAFAGLVLAFGGAVLLGLPALVLSLIAVAVIIVAWPLARRGDTPTACFALLDVLLPFTLGMLASGWSLAKPLAWQPLLVAAAFTAMQWGVLRAALPQGRSRARRFTLAIGVIAVLGSLVALGMPWAAATSAVLIVPSLYWLGDRTGASLAGGTRSAWSAPWLMLTLFVAALALR